LIFVAGSNQRSAPARSKRPIADNTRLLSVIRCLSPAGAASRRSPASKESKDELDVDGISHRDTIRSNSWPKPQIEQYFAKLRVVSSIGRWIEPEQLRFSLFVNIEKCGEMISLE
jgi:hypothetical protein